MLDPFPDPELKNLLLDRKDRLQHAIAQSPPTDHFRTLLRDVDDALEKMNLFTYGKCEVCQDPIERDRLIVNPLLRTCLDHLTAQEQKELEHDLNLAYQVQSNLLPPQGLLAAGWRTGYHYEPAGSVSGDYCDLIVPDHGEKQLYFFLGDVTGKGVAASIMMANLYAIFRSLVETAMPLPELVQRANRLFCEGTMSTHFATIVGGVADNAGGVELCNAGHPLPLLLHAQHVERIPSTGVPLGLFCTAEYCSMKLKLEPGESLFLYSDGLTETHSSAQTLYGEDRLASLLGQSRAVSPDGLIQSALEDLGQFRDGSSLKDDLTMLVLQRER